MARSKITRRRFLAETALAAGASLSAQALPARSQARISGANSRLRIGLIGCGRQGRRHLAHLQAQDPRAIECAAVADAFAPHRQQAAQYSGAQSCARWENLLEADLDAVIIATPDHLHAPILLAALDAGKHVFCEPPLGMNLEDAAAVRAAARASEKTVHIALPGVADPRWQKAQRLIAEGVLGRPRWCQAAYSKSVQGAPWPTATPENPTPENLDWQAFQGSAPARAFNADRFRQWRRHPEYALGLTGALHYDLLPPILAALHLGAPDRGSAAGGAIDPAHAELPDMLTATLEYTNGPTIVLTTARNGAAHPPILRGDAASIEIMSAGLRITPESGAPAQEIACSAGAPSPLEPWLIALRADKPAPDSLALAEAAHDAAISALRAWHTGRAAAQA